MARIDEDREILRKFAQLSVPKEGFDESKFAYCAEYVGANGIFLWQAKALGWKVISGDPANGGDPENPSLRDVNGNCVMGDVVYMKMDRKRYEQIQEARKALVREERGEKSREEIRADINDKLSKMVGQSVNVSFQFDDRRELTQRKT